MFVLVTIPPIGFLRQYMSDWLFLLIFFGYGIFILFPIIFAIGPIGRWFGRSLNEAAIANAKTERD